MPVVFFDPDSVFPGTSVKAHATWAAQFVAADPLNRRGIPISGNLQPTQIRDIIVRGVKNAPGGEAIFAVGHGGALQMAEGTVDLAPNKRMRLARGNQPPIFIDPFYDWVFQRAGMKPMSDKDQDEEWIRQNAAEKPGALQRIARFAIYKSIGAAVKDTYRVTFLTCRVGNSRDFIKKIAIDWQVLVKAYTRFVVFELNSQTHNARAYLEGDAPGTGTNIPLGETQVPQTDFITVGAPLATTP